MTVYGVNPCYFDGFSCIKPVLFIPCELWVIVRNVPTIQRHSVTSIHTMYRLYSDDFTKLCKLCKYDTININIIEHLFASCEDTADLQSTISQSILNFWGINIFNRYSCLNQKTQIITILTGVRPLCGNDEMCHVSLVNILPLFSKLLDILILYYFN